MALFKFGKKEANNEVGDANAKYKVLGSGCKKCLQLEKNVKEAVLEVDPEATVSHIFDLSKIAAYGVMSTPALLIGDKVVSSGKVLSKEEVISLIKG